MPPSSTIWEADPHTMAKIRIVEEYLKAWFPILGSWNGRIVYIDGFAGPGKYSGGEKGSPIVALETALQYQQFLQGKELILLFVEDDKRRHEHLESLIAEYHPLPSNIKVECICSEFGKTLNEILDSVISRGKYLAPTFLFIDPFGIKDVKFSTIQRFLANPACEIFVNFMFEHIYRFASTTEFAPHMDALFGSDKWRECLKSKDSACFAKLYEAMLDTVVKYRWRFEMINHRNKTCYYLYYGTNHLKGLEKMKDAMWKISPTGDYSFSDRNSQQITLFEEYFDPSPLQQMLLRVLKGKRISIDKVEEFVLVATPYRKAHTKKALAQLEKDNKINVPTPRTRARTYPRGTIIEFPDN